LVDEMCDVWLVVDGLERRGEGEGEMGWDGMGWEGVEGSVGGLVEEEEEGEEEEEDGGTGKGLEAGSRKWKGKIHGMG